jgi:predicted RNase H-like HicB family nuclease
MPKLTYPAVLERGAKGTYAVWFPDFPNCVAGGKSPEEAIEKGQHLVEEATFDCVEKEKPLPNPTAFERIKVPRNSDFIAFFAVTIAPPDPSERVNVYLPKSLIARADTRAAELGMSRSSFFGLALSSVLGAFGAERPPLSAISSRAALAYVAAVGPPRSRGRPRPARG